MTTATRTTKTTAKTSVPAQASHKATVAALSDAKSMRGKTDQHIGQPRKADGERKSPDTKTSNTDTKDTLTLYFAGMPAKEIKDKLIAAGKLLNGAAVTYAAKMAEAFNRNVHGQLGVTWDVFVKDITEGVAFDRAVWPTMVEVLKSTGMENKAIAEACKISDRTVKRLNVKAGRVNVNRVNGQATSVRAKTEDKGTLTADIAKTSARATEFANDDTKPYAPKHGNTDTGNVTSVVKNAKHDALVKALRSRDDFADIVRDLLTAK